MEAKVSKDVGYLHKVPYTRSRTEVEIRSAKIGEVKKKNERES